MEELLSRLGLLLVGFSAMMGPLLVMMLLLKRRDERESMLSKVIFRELNVPDLRGLFSVKIQSRLWGLHDTVTVQIWNCPSRRTWEVIMGLSCKLPPQVWLAVDGLPDPYSRSTYRLTVKRDISFALPTLTPGMKGRGACPC